MPVTSCPEYIKVSFGTVHEAASIFNTGKLDVFYAETRDLSQECSELKNYLSDDERSRADRFHFEKDRETYILCHALLRLKLAQSLNVNPLEITYKTGLNNKPGLTGDPVYFNLTHTRNAFSFAVSRDFCVGIDLEDIKQQINIHSVAKICFSKKEHNFIFNQAKGERDRFFLLWTRKEALLKALGTGITDNLLEIEVGEAENFIDAKLLTAVEQDTNLTEYFVYSKKISNSYISLAVPYQVSYDFHHLNKENIFSFIVL